MWVQSLLWLSLLLPRAGECPDDRTLRTGILSRSPVRDLMPEVSPVTGGHHSLWAN